MTNDIKKLKQRAQGQDKSGVQFQHQEKKEASKEPESYLNLDDFIPKKKMGKNMSQKYLKTAKMKEQEQEREFALMLDKAKQELELDCLKKIIEANEMGAH
jgi:DNA-directed RNA polymerase sigma subunit (sigma70/sigma32)